MQTALDRLGNPFTAVFTAWTYNHFHEFVIMPTADVVIVGVATS